MTQKTVEPWEYASEQIFELFIGLHTTIHLYTIVFVIVLILQFKNKKS